MNVIPSRASIDLDGRTLPGQSESAFLDELKAALGGDPELEILRSMPPVEATSKTPLFDHLAAVLKRHDPTGHPLPYLIPGFTDAKAYSRLGTICYGFAPVKFDPTHDVSFTRMYHGHDERAPTAGLKWGLEVLYDAVRGFAAGHSGDRT